MAVPRNVRVLGLASLLNDIAGEIVFPLLPMFLLTVIGAGTRTLGIVEGVADTTSSLVKLFSGTLSDRAGGRKSFVVVGYLLAAISRPLLALAAAPWQVLAARSGDRFGKGIRAAPRDAMIVDSTSPETRGRAFGFTQAMDHLGAAIGPALAFVFLWYFPGQLRLLFFLTVIPGALVVLLVLFGVREPRTHSELKPAFRLTIAPLSRDFRIYLVALVIFTLGNSSDAFLLVRVGDLGIPPAMLPLVWGAFHLVKSGASVLAGRAVDRFGPRPLIYLGWSIYALIYLGFGLATQAWQGWILFLLYGLFHALTEPAERTLVANLVDSSRKGLAYGWFNFAIGVSALPASVLFGTLYEFHGEQTAFTTSAALAIVAVVVMAVGVGRKGPGVGGQVEKVQ